jgi:GNAT superfamily N-acetyltransferase
MTTVHAATADGWDDVATVMGTKGDAAGCWCQWFRLRNADYGRTRVPERRAALAGQLGATPPPGVLAYNDAGEPVGWCGLGPRSAYPRLATSPVSKATQDEDGLWSIVCFVVRVGSRRQGTTEALLTGALDVAREHGARRIEAYPIDTAVRKPSSSELYHGALSVFLRAGFAEVARPRAERPVVRLGLS